MAINILEQVQENLYYPPLEKIDPNIHNNSGPDAVVNSNNFSQQAVPAVLTALYKYGSTDEGATDILHTNTSANWLSKIFKNPVEIIRKIISNTNKSAEECSQDMNTIAAEAVKITKENLPENATIKDVNTFFSGQVNNILPYLPAHLHLGDQLDDTTLDDNTNKMEGPISSLMHKIGSAFSSSETNEDKEPG